LSNSSDDSERIRCGWRQDKKQSCHHGQSPNSLGLKAALPSAIRQFPCVSGPVRSKCDPQSLTCLNIRCFNST
jgi:hypothetical protein